MKGKDKCHSEGLRFGIMLSVGAHLLQVIVIYGPRFEHEQQLESGRFWRAETAENGKTYMRNMIPSRLSS
jgi:hypothetical protein